MKKANEAKPSFSKQRILFGLPEGDFYAAEFVRLAVASGAKCRFVGYSWTTGRLVRSAGFPYQCVALRAHAPTLKRSPPSVAEFRMRGYAPHRIPSSAISAFSALGRIVETEIDREIPDVIIFGPIEHAVCHLLYAASSVRGISNHGFQPCYVSGCFVLNSHGPDWEVALRLAHVDSKERPSSQVSTPRMRSVGRPPRAKWSLWARGVESAVRLALGDNAWDTIATLSANAVARIARPHWFSGIPRIPPAGCQGDFVLVTLHQPCLPWASSNWEDLIEFCLVAVPEQYTLVIRPHPTEAPPRIGEAFRVKLLSRGVLISDPEAAPALSDLVAGCKAMFTLTSATGFQALLRGKMVFTLAPAFYCRSGLARQVSMEDAGCFDTWLAEGAPGPNQAMVEAFDQWMRFSCLLPYPTSAPEAAGMVLLHLFSADHE